MAGEIRRVVTGHDATGKAIVLMDGAATRVRENKSGACSTLLWVTDSTPADNSGDADGAEREVGVAPPLSGAIFRVVDFPPTKETDQGVSNEAVLKEMGLTAPAEGKVRHPGMHRTESIDYAVVLSGEIDMLLDDSEVHFKPGDVLVQRGTIHAWVNRGNEVCRIAFILIGAKP